MKVNKVINNNVISVINDQNKELVVMGKGIGFQAKPNDLVDQSKVEKIFILEDNETSRKLQDLLERVPLEVMEITEQIIQYAKTVYGKQLNDSIYVALTDHINFSIDRIKKGIPIKNALLWELKRIYREEYEIGEEAVKMIYESLGIQFPEDEVGFIAMHFINAKANEDNSNIEVIAKVINNILNIVKYHFNVEFDEESIDYFHFLTHLRFLAQRLLNGTYLKSKDGHLLELIKVQYKRAYECTLKINIFIKKQYKYELTDDEKLYLTIHINRIVNL